MNGNSNSNNVRPDYYNPDSTYEPRKVINAWDAGFNLGNALKYIGRAGKKKTASRIEDLKKARTYIDFEIASLEEAASIEQSPVMEIPVTEPEAPPKTSKEINSLIGTKWKCLMGIEAGDDAEIFGWTYDYSRQHKRTKLLVRYTGRYSDRESLVDIEDFFKNHKRVGETQDEHSRYQSLIGKRFTDTRDQTRWVAVDAGVYYNDQHRLKLTNIDKKFCDRAVKLEDIDRFFNEENDQ